MSLRSQLLLLTRNFGAFNAIAAGLEAASGDRMAVLAADLQEPPELVAQFSDILRSGRAEVVFGVRASRSDPWLSELLSTAFWWSYRRFVVREIPPGGVDVFGCSRRVRDQLLTFSEIQTNVIALLFWMGYQREFVPYVRRPRLEGISAWTFAKKLRYCIDSVFSFTDLPLRFLLSAGAVGCTIALILGMVVVVSRLVGGIEVPGYTPLILTIVFFGGLTTLGLGVVGQYLWLTLQNTRRRPNYLVNTRESWMPAQSRPRTVRPTSGAGVG
jgi:glycosyltransferase involved in cell wall biosynthesis